MIIEEKSSYTCCPAHAHVVSGDGVWMEGEALAQFARVASLAGCVGAAAMPDLHPGRGIPIGAAFAVRDVVYPQLIGGDAGCGARVVVTSLDRVGRGRLERRLADAFDGSPLDDVDPRALFAAVFRGGARALAPLDGVPEGLRALAANEPDDHASDGDHDAGAPFVDGDFARYLGTIGGGNHFAEISEVGDVVDDARARALGIARNAVVVLAHSGSRGLGDALARRWGDSPLRGEARERYLTELAGACRFARANRLVLAYRLLAALGATRPSDVCSTFDVTHNDVRLEPHGGGDAYVHRKGAAPAHAEQLTTVLGSRGAPTWILAGTGAAKGLASVAHGAGRRMGRSEARAKIRARYTRAELRKSKLGGQLLCNDAELLLEEHPDVYKAVEPVVAAVEAHGLARRVAALHPIFTAKL